MKFVLIGGHLIRYIQFQYQILVSKFFPDDPNKSGRSKTTALKSMKLLLASSSLQEIFFEHFCPRF